MNLEWKTCLKVGVSVFVLYLCIHFWPAILKLIGTLLGAATPLLIGAMVAYLLNILMCVYERKFFPSSRSSAVQKLRRPVCMVGAMLTLVAIVVLVCLLVVPQLGSCFRLVFAKLPGFMEQMLKKVETWGIFSADTIALLENIDWQSRIGQIVSSLGGVMEVLFSAVSSVFSGLVTGLLAVIFAIYLLAGKERLTGQWNRLIKRYLPAIWCGKLSHVLDVLNDCFHKYIVGQCTEALILGLLCMLGMTLLRLPYAAMIGALIAFTALIPVAGGWIGAGVGAFLILMESPVQALIFVIFILILQQLENNLIYPKVVGSSIGLPGIWVLAAVTIGGGVLGVAGMLLGVPVFAAVYRLLRDDIHKYDPPEAETETKETET